jgi:hypothetical protein
MARTGLAFAGFARGLGLLDFIVLDFDLAGTDLTGIGIPELGLFWPSLIHTL